MFGYTPTNFEAACASTVAMDERGASWKCVAFQPQTTVPHRAPCYVHLEDIEPMGTARLGILPLYKFRLELSYSPEDKIR